jgi:hypothetical protein
MSTAARRPALTGFARPAPRAAEERAAGPRSLTICGAIRLRLGVPSRSAWAILVTCCLLTFAGIGGLCWPTGRLMMTGPSQENASRICSAQRAGSSMCMPRAPGAPATLTKSSPSCMVSDPLPVNTATWRPGVKTEQGGQIHRGRVG